MADLPINKPTRIIRYYNLDLVKVFNLLREKFGIEGDKFEEIEREGADYIKVDTNSREFIFATAQGDEI